MKTYLLSTLVLFSKVATVAGVRGQSQSTPRILQRALKETQSQKACDNAMEDDIYTCECIDLNENQTVLECVDEVCLYCNNDSSVCGSPTATSIFGLDGVAESFVGMFTYTKGLTDTISVAMTMCSEDDDEELVCTSCSVSVNDQDCNQCELKNCTEGAVAGTQMPFFDCTNIEAGAIYDTCDPALIIPTGSVFESLSTGGFQNCTMFTEMPSAAPTMLPSLVPSITASEVPSVMPSAAPTTTPPTISPAPTDMPSVAPTESPTLSPMPTTSPTNMTDAPTLVDTDEPTFEPNATDAPTPNPTSGSATYFSISAVSLLLLALVL